MNCNRWATIRGDTCWPSPASTICCTARIRMRRRIQLAGDRPYKVDLIDPWEMTVLPLGTAQPGEYTRPAGQSRTWPTVSPLRRRREAAAGSQDLGVGPRTACRR